MSSSRSCLQSRFRYIFAKIFRIARQRECGIFEDNLQVSANAAIRKIFQKDTEMDFENSSYGSVVSPKGTPSPTTKISRAKGASTVLNLYYQKVKKRKLSDF